MKLFLEMSKDLGSNKVGAVYDIRDKKDENGNLTKIGVFTSIGRLKSPYKNQFEIVMRDFMKYFNKF